jgi:hypothetical protein
MSFYHGSSLGYLSVGDQTVIVSGRTVLGEGERQLWAEQV